MKSKQKLYLFIFLFIIGKTNAQEEIIRKNNFNIDNNRVAIQEYDVISYFTSSTPRKGRKEYKHEYKGIIYYFENEKTLNIFKLNPEKWEPAYGGWCAFAMGNTGEKVEINPATYKIINNKLYLFYNAYLTNTLLKWNKDEQNLKLKADKNWKNKTQ